jgi:hypothetical protein
LNANKPYHKVRYSWWKEHSLTELTKELKTRFTIVRPSQPDSDKVKLSLFRKERGAIEVKADTLWVFLSNYVAVLFQKEKVPFTEKDWELKETIFKLYNHSRSTPLPWGW